MKDIGRYKKDLFYIYPEDNGMVLLETLDGNKAAKYDMTIHQGNPYDLLVPANEVEELYDEEYYRRKLFNLDMRFREYLNKYLFHHEYPIEDELRIEFKKNSIKLSNKAKISVTGPEIIRITDGKKQYSIEFYKTEIIVKNGGRI